MKASSANFLTVIKGPKQFVIPIYQRTYSWQIAQCNKLFNDILRISKDGSSPGHFIGSVVYFQESIHTVSDVPKLLVIDGIMIPNTFVFLLRRFTATALGSYSSVSANSITFCFVLDEISG